MPEDTPHKNGTTGSTTAALVAAGDVLATLGNVRTALQKEALTIGGNGHATAKAVPKSQTDTSVYSVSDVLETAVHMFPESAAGNDLATRLQLRLIQLEDRCAEQEATIARKSRENDALKKTNILLQAGLDNTASTTGGSGAHELRMTEARKRHAEEVAQLNAALTAAKQHARESEERCRTLEHTTMEQSELGDAQMEIHNKIKTLYKETLLKTEGLEKELQQVKSQLEVERQRSAASQEQVASSLKLANHLKEYIKNKELECESLTSKLRDTKLKLDEEQARASEEHSVFSSARNTLAVAEVELEVKTSQIKELEKAKEHEEQTRAELLQQLYDLQSRFESIQQNEQMCRQQLESANQARKALDDRLKTTTQTLLARIEAFEALKSKLTDSEATRRKLRKIARTQREKLETSHREILLFRHHEAWHQVQCRLGMHAEERLQRMQEEELRKTNTSTSRGRRDTAASVGGPFTGGRLSQPRQEGRWVP